jgi:uncharacterized repeat protein (TIGR01451 family)
MRITSLTLCGLLAFSALAFGQDYGQRRYFPLNTPFPPPGRAGMWAGGMGKAVPMKFQQLQIQLPVQGQVTWYEGGAQGRSMPAPAMAGLLVGPVYRVKLSGLTDLPGVELYPSIELVDRLHPPAGLETQFPVIVPFTEEELEAAIQGSLVVKVIYLEQPNRALPITSERGKAIPALRVGPHENPLEVADVHGRPLAIVRLGGRVPDANRPEPGFFGTGAPVTLSKARDTREAASAMAPSQSGLQTLTSSRTIIRPQSDDSEADEVIRATPTVRTPAAGVARYQFSGERQPTVQPTVVQQGNRGNVRRVSNTDQAVERIDASPRTPAGPTNVYAAGPVCDDDGPSPQKYSDEYLFDGGDRSLPVTRNGEQFQGIDTEDTIAEYKDHEGRTKVKKSNWVAIYSPRFGSVVTISQPNSDTIVDKAAGHVVAQQGVGMRVRQSVDEKRQNLDSVRLQTRSRPTGIGTEVGTDSLTKELNREVGVSVMKAGQSRGRLIESQFQENLKATSSKGRQFAEYWTRKDSPVLEGHAFAATQTVTLQVTAEYVGLEDNGKRGDLLLIKTADRGEASIGDVITFTIHYENRGDKELRSVVIIDNLSPRLEFKPDSVKTDRPGQHTVNDNDEGSVVLKFTLDDPLPGRTKGSITFQTTVK